MQVEPFCGRLNHAGEILSESKDLGQENIRLSGGEGGIRTTLISASL
jgi:hypothetical protein